MESEIKRILPSIRLTSEFEEFVRFSATPRALREVKTQEMFAKKFGVSPDTLSDWKKLPGFAALIRHEILAREKSDLPEVINALREKAKEGNPGAIRLWLQYVGELQIKGQKKAN